MNLQLFALQSFNHTGSRDGFLLFTTEVKATKFLDDVKFLQSDKTHKYGSYKVHGTVNVPDWIFKKMETHTNFFVRHLDTDGVVELETTIVEVVPEKAIEPQQTSNEE